MGSEDFPTFKNPDRLDGLIARIQKLEQDQEKIRRGAAARGALHFGVGFGLEQYIQPEATTQESALIEIEIPAGYRSGMFSGLYVVEVESTYASPLSWHFHTVHLLGYGAELLQPPDLRLYMLPDQDRDQLVIPFGFNVTTNTWAAHTAQITLMHESSTPTLDATMTARGFAAAVFQQ